MVDRASCTGARPCQMSCTVDSSDGSPRLHHDAHSGLSGAIPGGYAPDPPRWLGWRPMTGGGRPSWPRKRTSRHRPATRPRFALREWSICLEVRFLDGASTPGSRIYDPCCRVGDSSLMLDPEVAPRDALSAVARRFSWGIADQAVSSLTNFALGLLVARSVGPAELGSFALVFNTYLIALCLTRVFSTDPLLIRLQHVL